MKIRKATLEDIPTLGELRKLQLIDEGLRPRRGYGCGAVRLFPSLQSMLKEGCFGGADSEYPDIKIAALGNDAGVIGAASLT